MKQKRFEVLWYDMDKVIKKDIIVADSAEEAERLAKMKYPIDKRPAPLCTANDI